MAPESQTAASPGAAPQIAPDLIVQTATGWRTVEHTPLAGPASLLVAEAQ